MAKKIVKERKVKDIEIPSNLTLQSGISNRHSRTKSNPINRKVYDHEISGEEISGKTKKKNINKELYWVLGAMIGLFILFLVSYSIFQNMKKIDYEGLKFTKEMFGEIPLFHYSYIGKVKTITGNVVSEQNKKIDLYLRNDPRENDIPIEGNIEFPEGKRVYIGIGDKGVVGCKYSIIGLATLSSFLTQNGLSVRAGSLEEEGAKRNNLEHITCEKYPDNVVILIDEGAFTKVRKVGNNCYLIDANNCETLPAIEKFIVKAVLDAKKRAIQGGKYNEKITLE